MIRWKVLALTGCFLAGAAGAINGRLPFIHSIPPQQSGTPEKLALENVLDGLDKTPAVQCFIEIAATRGMDPLTNSAAAFGLKCLAEATLFGMATA